MNIDFTHASEASVRSARACERTFRLMEKFSLEPLKKKILKKHFGKMTV